MGNQVLCENLYQRGYKLYLESWQKMDAMFQKEYVAVNEDAYASKSFSELQSLASAGDREAQYCLADCYAGEGRFSEAIAWFERSAQNGCADAMEMLGNLYTGLVDGTQRDKKKSLYWLNKAIERGCSTYAVTMMVQAYLREDDPSYEDLANALEWAMHWATLMQDDEEECRTSVEHVLSLLKLLVLIDLEMFYENPQCCDYQETENYALLAYYWQGISQDIGAEEVVKTHEILCWIGECAMRMNRAYAKPTLEEAMEKGSDYAAVLLVREAIDKAVDTKTTPMGPTMYHVVDNLVFASNPVGPKQLKMADAQVKAFFPKVRAAANNSGLGKYRQAEALYRLSHFYIFGLCCKRSANEAHALLERAAALGHQSAQNLLNKMFRKKLFGWEFC